MPKVRKDNKGRNLRPGETQRSDGSYMFVYKLGKKKKYIYDFDLASLRAKEKVLNRDSDDGIRTQEAMKITLNDMFKVLMDTKIQLKASTRANYEYLWNNYGYLYAYYARKHERKSRGNQGQFGANVKIAKKGKSA